MVRRQAKWLLGEATQAFLAALDISGFSNDPTPDRLLHLRHAFLRSVEKTALLQRERSNTRVHFLGDELRLAFHVDVGVAQVRDFVTELLADLKKTNLSVETQRRVHLRTVLLAGPVTWSQWHDCHFLDGPLPAKAQFWMSHLAPSEIAADTAFSLYLDVAGLTAPVAIRTIANERAHILTLTC